MISHESLNTRSWVEDITTATHVKNRVLRVLHNINIKPKEWETKEEHWLHTYRGFVLMIVSISKMIER